ncbi:MAG: NrfD/PsrC family molybdoenzyme membrane anchor subunit [Gemmatimonadaceae bacterium]
MTADTWFSTSPHWGWLITLYFFCGGIAGGALFLAGLLHILGRPTDRPTARLAHYLALAGAVVSGVLLTIDLDKPLRFWHMLFDANAGTLMFKSWSPMSVGAWGLLLFSGVAMLAVLGSLYEEGRLRWGVASALSGRFIRSTVAVAGAVLGLFLAGYTGVLLAVTNRPLWADSNWLGVLFLCSGVSTAIASLMLLSRRQVSPLTLGWLTQFDQRVMFLELAVLLTFVISLGPMARVLLNWWGFLLVAGVAGAGIVAPLFIEHRRAGGTRVLTRAPMLVLLGGLLLRVVVIFASEQAGVAGKVASAW